MKSRVPNSESKLSPMLVIIKLLPNLRSESEYHDKAVTVRSQSRSPRPGPPGPSVTVTLTVTVTVTVGPGRPPAGPPGRDGRPRSVIGSGAGGGPSWSHRDESP
jgi:hypothetical protein